MTPCKKHNLPKNPAKVNPNWICTICKREKRAARLAAKTIQVVVEPEKEQPVETISDADERLQMAIYEWSMVNDNPHLDTSPKFVELLNKINALKAQVKKFEDKINEEGGIAYTFKEKK